MSLLPSSPTTHHLILPVPFLTQSRLERGCVHLVCGNAECDGNCIRLRSLGLYVKKRLKLRMYKIFAIYCHIALCKFIGGNNLIEFCYGI
jgi:hypothetical protein